MNFWNLYNEIKKFDQLSTNDKQKLLDMIFEESSPKQYNFALIVSNLLPKIDAGTSLRLLKHYIENGNDYTLKSDHLCSIVRDVYKYEENKKDVKDIIFNSSFQCVNRALLVVDDLNAVEEEKGLRALSSSKYTPDCVLTTRYKPSAQIIKKLPPVMRLNILESLSNEIHIAYNIFENLGDIDDFRSLLFGSVLRHPKRAEKMVERYREIVGLGKPGVIKIKSACNNCGEYEITIRSDRIKTVAGLDKSRIGRLVNSHCALCGKYTQNKSTIITEKEE